MIQIFIGVWHERPRLARGPAVTESLAGKSSALDGASAGSAKARLFSACLYAQSAAKTVLCERNFTSGGPRSFLYLNVTLLFHY